MKNSYEEVNEGFSRGWVKLYRSILDSPIIKNPNLSQLYMWCLLKANHSDAYVPLKIGKGYSEVSCKRGQFITGRKRAIEELGMSPSTYYKNSKKLEEYGYITVESNNHYSIVTVVNYGVSEAGLISKEQHTIPHKDSKRNTKEQPRNTNNNIKKNKKNKEKKEYNIISPSLPSDSIDFEHNEFFQFAYRYIRFIIHYEYPNISRLRNQLSFDEVYNLLKVNCWSQIENLLCQIEEWLIDRKTWPNSVSGILNSFIKNGKHSTTLNELKENELYLSWHQRRQYTSMIRSKKKIIQRHIREDVDYLKKEKFWKHYDLQLEDEFKIEFINEFEKFELLLATKPIIMEHCYENRYFKQFLQMKKQGVKYEDLVVVLNKFLIRQEVFMNFNSFYNAFIAYLNTHREVYSSNT